jgi:hypothetical protein
MIYHFTKILCNRNQSIMQQKPKYYATETKVLLCNRKNVKWIGVQ